ncbi:MAG: ferritin-like domain-containing protein [Thermoanaerobaculales bacterium]|jgi:ferritin-like protein|nr:ferritin-like domain-containing protein [Thermoanaerobaculales bacterium]
MAEYHEKWEELPAETRDLHRAIKSLQEELEAVDWYHQRVAVTDDNGLRAILEHNRNEEIEHAAMLLEWLRRSMDGWDEELRSYLFTPGPLAEIEEGHHD